MSKYHEDCLCCHLIPLVFLPHGIVKYIAPKENDTAEAVR